MMYHPNCKLYLGMENNLGNLAKDDSGNGNHGTNNGASAVAGKFGGAASFDGINDYFNMGTFAKPSNFTISVWVNFSSYSQAAFAGIVFASDSANGWGLSANFNNGKIFARVSNGSSFQHWILDELNSTNYPSGWHYLTFSGNGSTLYYYKNGIIAATVPQTVANTGSGALSVGRWGSYAHPIAYFNGLIDELTIWNVALSQSNIQRLMLGLTPII